MKIRKGDKVRVLTGKDRGKEGVVSRALPADDKVIIAGISLAKRHQTPTNATMQGGIIDKAMPIHVSNVAVLSPADEKPTRIGYRLNDDGSKVRVCRRTGVDLDG